MNYGGRPHGMVYLWCCWLYQWREEGDGKQQNYPSECGQLTAKMTGQVYICTHTEKHRFYTKSVHVFSPWLPCNPNVTSAMMSASDSSSVHEENKISVLAFHNSIHSLTYEMHVNEWMVNNHVIYSFESFYVDWLQTQKKGFVVWVFCSETKRQIQRWQRGLLLLDERKWMNERTSRTVSNDPWTFEPELKNEKERMTEPKLSSMQVMPGSCWWMNSVCLYLGTLVALLKGLSFPMVFKEASQHTGLVNYRCQALTCNQNVTWSRQQEVIVNQGLYLWEVSITLRVHFLCSCDSWHKPMERHFWWVVQPFSIHTAAPTSKERLSRSKSAVLVSSITMHN